MDESKYSNHFKFVRNYDFTKKSEIVSMEKS